jgi:hypothetical protein
LTPEYVFVVPLVTLEPKICKSRDLFVGKYFQVRISMTIPAY